MVALLFGLFDATKTAGFTVEWMESVVSAMPLGQQGFPWLLPTVAGLVAGKLAGGMRKG